MNKLAAPVLLLSVLLAGCPKDEPEPADGGASVIAPDASTSFDGGGSVITPEAGASFEGGTSRDASLPVDTGARGDSASSDAAPAEAGRPAADLDLERQAIEKFKACGMYEPSIDPAEYSIEDEYDRCAARCLLAAPCAQVATAVCDEDDTAFLDCILDCPEAPADGFRCRNGSVIPHAALCDVIPDCSQDEDETNCGEFRCADGEIIPAASARCDYLDDCLDGSDERGCAFSCL